MDAIEPLDFLIFHFESCEFDRIYTNKLRVSNKKAYSYSLYGAACDAYLLYRKLRKYKTAARWEDNAFVFKDKKFNTGIPSVVSNWILGNDFLGFNIISYLSLMNDCRLSFKQVAQLMKVQFYTCASR